MSEQRNDGGADAATSTDEDRDGSVGEISAQPREQRRAEDPGSMATEFGDRVDEAPDGDIAHPSI